MQLQRLKLNDFIHIKIVNKSSTYFHSKSDEIKMTNKRNIEHTAMMADVCTVVLLR